MMLQSPTASIASTSSRLTRSQTRLQRRHSSHFHTGSRTSDENNMDAGDDVDPMNATMGTSNRRRRATAAAGVTSLPAIPQTPPFVGRRRRHRRDTKEANENEGTQRMAKQDLLNLSHISTPSSTSEVILIDDSDDTASSSSSPVKRMVHHAIENMPPSRSSLRRTRSSSSVTPSKRHSKRFKPQDRPQEQDETPSFNKNALLDRSNTSSGTKKVNATKKKTPTSKSKKPRKSKTPTSTRRSSSTGKMQTRSPAVVIQKENDITPMPRSSSSCRRRLSDSFATVSSPIPEEDEESVQDQDERTLPQLLQPLSQETVSTLNDGAHDHHENMDTDSSSQEPSMTQSTTATLVRRMSLDACTVATLRQKEHNVELKDDRQPKQHVEQSTEVSKETQQDPAQHPGSSQNQDAISEESSTSDGNNMAKPIAVPPPLLKEEPVDDLEECNHGAPKDKKSPSFKELNQQVTMPPKNLVLNQTTEERVSPSNNTVIIDEAKPDSTQKANSPGEPIDEQSAELAKTLMNVKLEYPDAENIRVPSKKVVAHFFECALQQEEQHEEPNQTDSAKNDVNVPHISPHKSDASNIEATDAIEGDGKQELLLQKKAKVPDQVYLQPVGLLSLQQVMLPSVSQEQNQAMKRVQAKLQRDPVANAASIELVKMGRKHVMLSTHHAMQTVEESRKARFDHYIQQQHQRIAGIQKAQQDRQEERERLRRERDERRALKRKHKKRERFQKLQRQNLQNQSWWREVATLMTEKAQLEKQEKLWQQALVDLEEQEKATLSEEATTDESTTTEADGIDKEEAIVVPKHTMQAQLEEGLTDFKVTAGRIINHYQQSILDKTLPEATKLRSELYRSYRNDHQFAGYLGATNPRAMIQYLSQTSSQEESPRHSVVPKKREDPSSLENENHPRRLAKLFQDFSRLNEDEDEVQDSRETKDTADEEPNTKCSWMDQLLGTTTTAVANSQDTTADDNEMGPRIYTQFSSQEDD